MFHLKIHSPEEEIHYPVFQEKGLHFFIKRDDLIHPFISGNKWRKLKYTLTKAKELEKNHLVTFGGAYSNHILATAVAGGKFQFKTTAFIRGEEIDNEILSLCKIFGMQLIFVSRADYKNKTDLFNQYFGKNPNSYFIDEGGAGKEAELGCREIIQELENQYDHIFCSAGTGTTAAGIVNQLANNDSLIKFHLVPALKGGSFLKTEIAAFLEKEFDYEIHDSYHFGGYAKTQPALINLIKDFAQTTGVLTDPVYTGKTLFCITDLAHQNYFKPGSKILMIHTGGIFGILGMLKQF